MKKTAALAAILFLFLAMPAFAEICSTASPAEEQTEEKGIPLKFINNSGTEIKGVFISDTGRNSWSENLLRDTPIKDGDNRSIDIKRGNILGLTDIKIIYFSGKERIWEKLPILEIFEITHNKDGGPDFERIKLGT